MNRGKPQQQCAEACSSFNNLFSFKHARSNTNFNLREMKTFVKSNMTSNDDDGDDDDDDDGAQSRSRPQRSAGRS